MGGSGTFPFRKMDNDLAELARQRSEEIRASGGHQRTINKLIEAAEVLEGTRPPEIAVNWKGQLLGMSQTAVSQDRLKPNAKNIVSRQTEDVKIVSKGPATSRSPLTQKEPKPSATSKWPYIVVGIALLTILAAQRHTGV